MKENEDGVHKEVIWMILARMENENCHGKDRRNGESQILRGEKKSNERGNGDEKEMSNKDVLLNRSRGQSATKRTMCAHTEKRIMTEQ